MRIIDLSKEHEELYFVCLEDWSEEMKEAGDHKCNWYNKIKDKGLRVKLAIDDNGSIGGMIQYVPIEYSEAEGENIYFIKCIWVHGHKEGIGNYQGKGMGAALLKAAEADAKSLGAKGIAAWGLAIPVWMRASWYKNHGYKKIDKDSIKHLVWKPFYDDAIPPKWIKRSKKPATNINPGKVTITAFSSGWCQVENIVYERARKAAEEFGDKVVFNSIDTFNKDTLLEWGISNGLFIEDVELSMGPPVPYDKIVKVIAKKLRKISKG